MSKKAVGLLLVLIVAISIGAYTFFSKQTKGVSGLRVAALPGASVFLNDQLVGKTPYDQRHPSGSYTLKLIPEDSSGSVSSWQGSVTLVPSLLTYVNRDLGPSEVMSGGEVLTLEKLPANEAQVAVFSTPDASVVLLDGQEKGVTPLLLRDVVPGEHDVAVNAPGFIGRTVRTQVTAGYKLSVQFQLAMSENPVPTPEATSSATTGGSRVETSSGSTVTIKDTPTGFLRVRSSPSTSSTEVAQVKPGEKFPLVEEQDGWYKITYAEGKDGWVSGRYAEK